MYAKLVPETVNYISFSSKFIWNHFYLSISFVSFIWNRLQKYFLQLKHLTLMKNWLSSKTINIRVGMTWSKNAHWIPGRHGFQPGISEKNKHMQSILSSLENSCSLLFSSLKSHSDAYSEPCQTSKIKLLPKIVNGFWPLNIFTKNFILDVWQGSDYASIIFSKVAGLQPSTLLKDGLLYRYFSRILATYQEYIWRAASKETDGIKSAVKVPS